jgi:hypothetical protein
MIVPVVSYQRAFRVDRVKSNQHLLRLQFQPKLFLNRSEN